MATVCVGNIAFPTAFEVNGSFSAFFFSLACPVVSLIGMEVYPPCLA